MSLFEFSREIWERFSSAAHRQYPEVDLSFCTAIFFVQKIFSVLGPGVRIVPAFTFQQQLIASRAGCRLAVKVSLTSATRIKNDLCFIRGKYAGRIYSGIECQAR